MPKWRSCVDKYLDVSESLNNNNNNNNNLMVVMVDFLARVVLRLPWGSSVSAAIYKLGWLRVEERVIYKIAVLTCYSHESACVEVNYSR